MAQVPHFSLPLRIIDGRAQVNEQDSFDDIRDCVEAVVRCPLGYRPEAPTFGVRDQTFVEGAPDARVVEEAGARWEPRALTDAEAAVVDAVVARITVGIEAGEETSG